MGLYNFMPRFEPMILDWSKRHTIRGERAHPDVPGDPMYNYTGLRHPGARCLMRPMCIRTEFIRIEGGPQTPFRILMGFSLALGTGIDAGKTSVCGEPIYGNPTGGPHVRLAEDELQALAWRDGFRPEGSTEANPGDAFRLMMSFWTGRLPFEGTVYHWNPARQLGPDPLLPRRWRWVDVAPPAAVSGPIGFNNHPLSGPISTPTRLKYDGNSDPKTEPRAAGKMAGLALGSASVGGR